MADRSAEEWGEEYRRDWSRRDTFSRKLHELLHDLLGAAGIDVVQTEVRTKSVESFVEKLQRKEGKYVTPLDDVTDLTGVRIITYYVEDVEVISAIIRQELDVDEAHSIDKSAALDPDRFGYVSVHFVVRLTKDRNKLAEWSTYSDMCAEIQVRTALQHAWSAVDHKLKYKRPGDVPRALQRRLFRLSALFEMADEQFSDLRREWEAVAEQYEESVAAGDLMLTLDRDSLDAYMQENERVAHVLAVCARAGWTPRGDADQKRLNRDRTDLLSRLRVVGAESIADFDQLLSTPDEVIEREMALLGKKSDEHGISRDITADDVLTQFVLLVKRATTEQIRPTYTQDVAVAFSETLAELNTP